MTKESKFDSHINKIIKEHEKWISNIKEGCRADLRRADLAGADLAGADLRRADLGEANLRRADLAGADLRRADLAGADLAGANIRRADLAGANLAEANLRRADLAGANLPGADLEGADLAEANLRGANIAGANLRGANIEGANLPGADLAEADLVHRLIDSYIYWLKEKFTFKKIGDGFGVTTPFLNRFNDHIQIYVKSESEQNILICDDGETFKNLELSGVDLNSEKRKRELTIILNGFGVKLESGELKVKASIINFPLRKHSLIQAILAIDSKI